MAKINNMYPGQISGKVGNMVYYLRNGVQYARKLPVRSEKMGTEPMLQQQQKFSRLSKLIIPLVPLFRSSFKRFTHRMNGYNKAISVNSTNGFLGAHAPFDFDFSKLVVGDGNICSAEIIVVQSSGSGELIFYWMGRSGGHGAHKEDLLYVAAYCCELNSWIYKTDAAFRIAHICKLDASPFKGKSVHVYAGFISAYGHDASRSAYLGMVDI